ncbi:hypothetical protein O6H91_12G054100 [Diphasiastrum complanatum]|uniref:Uncharacterized protein n=1 Tax=Diphasiastrum complanatum TaxID=34168 RepID=A0ACC2C1Z3_DIPCM|nr:hypothetical protein O6H91_12G054100 [Diphasiastrum complanatum]
MMAIRWPLACLTMQDDVAVESIDPHDQSKPLHSSPVLPQLLPQPDDHNPVPSVQGGSVRPLALRDHFEDFHVFHANNVTRPPPLGGQRMDRLSSPKQITDPHNNLHFYYDVHCYVHEHHGLHPHFRPLLKDEQPQVIVTTSVTCVPRGMRKIEESEGPFPYHAKKFDYIYEHFVSVHSDSTELVTKTTSGGHSKVSCDCLIKLTPLTPEKNHVSAYHLHTHCHYLRHYHKLPHAQTSRGKASDQEHPEPVSETKSNSQRIKTTVTTDDDILAPKDSATHALPEEYGNSGEIVSPTNVRVSLSESSESPPQTESAHGDDRPTQSSGMPPDFVTLARSETLSSSHSKQPVIAEGSQSEVDYLASQASTSASSQPQSKPQPHHAADDRMPHAARKARKSSWSALGAARNKN